MGWLRASPKEPCRFVGWMECLGEAKESLQGLINNMEGEFLELGRSLQCLSENATQIQNQCTMLADLTEGREEDPAVQFAFQLLKKAEDLILATDEQYEHVFTGFNQLQESLRAISLRYDQMIRTLSPLTFIIFQLRIQSIQHETEVQAVFSTLADEIASLVSQVQSVLESQFDDLEVARLSARKMHLELAESFALQKKHIEVTWGSSRKHLRELSEAMASSGTMVTDLASINRLITGHIGRVIMAQQYQDITRQKVEHIGTAMDQISSQLGTARDGQVGSASRAAACHFVAKAGAIQIKQVEGVFEELSKAAKDIVDGVSGILESSAAAAKSAISVGDTTLSAGVVQQCKDSVSGILSLIHEPVSNISLIVETLEPLQSKLNNCGKRAGDFVRKVRLSSINAQVFSSHVPKGEALAVLAHRMQEISDEMISEVRMMSDDIDKLSATLQNLEHRLTDFQELGRMDEGLLVGESEISHKKLGDFETLLPTRIQSLKHLQTSFSRTSEDMVSCVKFPKAIDAARPWAIGLFRELTEWAASLEQNHEATSMLPSQVDLLRQGYTMQSERAMHDAALSQTKHEILSDDAVNIEMFEGVPATIAPEAADAQQACELFGDFEMFDSASPPEASTIPEMEQAECPPVELRPLVTAEKEDLGDNVELF